MDVVRFDLGSQDTLMGLAGGGDDDVLDDAGALVDGGGEGQPAFLGVHAHEPEGEVGDGDGDGVGGERGFRTGGDLAGRRPEGQGEGE
ncbi:MAG: hypothetical protein M5U12_21965 [Verrucomicrobia bacterium]|nr:hypothetical protein [Verrucomicrobiota bacterium]